MKTRAPIPLLALVLLTLSQFPSAFAQGTAFTYQGRLTDGTAPANGTYDLQFSVYDSLSAGLIVGAPLTNSSTAVSNGLFTVALDFGSNVFTGPARWLEISVRTNGSTGAYQTLSPRQAFTAAPYAVTAGSVTGVLPSAAISGTYSGAVTFSNAANIFAGNGAGLTALNAGQLLGTVPASALSNAWQVAGNSGANPTNNIFLGTTDNLPLEIRVNGNRAFRVEPSTNGSANIIGGWSNNFVYPNASQAFIGGGGGQSVVSSSLFTNIVSDAYGVIGGGIGNTAGNTNSDPTDARGATVGGGGNNVASAAFSTVAGGQNNYAQANYAFVGGGVANTNQENFSAIAGGQGNFISPLADHAFIGAGLGNRIFGSAGPVHAVIVGGQNNTIQSNVSYSIIGGGNANTIQTNVQNSVIAGGYLNIIGAGAISSTIGGGQNNVVIAPNATISGGEFNSTGTNSYFATISGGGYSGIGSNASSSTISGGYSNTITNNTLDSVIGGGSFNHIGDTSTYSTIAGGRASSIGDNATAATIGGGFNNFVGFAAAYAVVPGGYNNYAGGSYSFAAGYQAQASHIGTFVWADPGSAPFTSTGTNQFLIRAAGGVGINTNAPSGAALNVAGTVRATSFQGDGSGLTGVNAATFPSYIFAYSGAAQAVAVGNTFQDINFSTDSQLNGWTHTAGTSQYTNSQTGLYLVQFYGQFVTTAANGTNAQMRAELNGTEIPGSRTAVSVSSLSEVATVSKSILVSANASDYLTLQFTGSGTGIRLSGSANATLTVTRIQ